MKVWILMTYNKYNGNAKVDDKNVKQQYNKVQNF